MISREKVEKLANATKEKIIKENRYARVDDFSNSKKEDFYSLELYGFSDKGLSDTINVLINLKDKTSHIENLSVANSQQGAGTKILGNIVELAIKLDIKSISLRAAEPHARSEYSGGYVWARAGFTTTTEAWGILRKELKVDLDKMEITEERQAQKRVIEKALESKNPQAIWQLSDTRDLGRELLMNAEFRASINLKNKKAMVRLEACIELGKQKSKGI